MLDFLQSLKEKNDTLYYFGLANILLSGVFLVLTQATATQVAGVNAWYKPFKFALSIGVYAWTMLLYCSYLPHFNLKMFNWATIVLLGFEIIYIAVQAQRGQLSHFNLSSPFYNLMYMLMAAAASLVAIYTAYVAILFFKNDFPNLPDHYVWAIRAGLIIFVVFSFQGFAMGSRLTHTIGGADGSEGLPLVGWSKTLGDLRIAHFLGMHALQIIPFVAYYALRSSKMVVLFALFYTFFTLFTFIQALQGKPFLKNL